MKDCIFCRVSAGEFATKFVYEDENLIVFRDINPKSNTHLLIVPRVHIASVADFRQEDAPLIADMILTARKVAKDLNISGYKLLFNVGEDGGQEIFHVHLHLLSNS